MSLPIRIFFVIVALTLFCGVGLTQSTDNKGSVFSKPGEAEKDDRPKGFRETLEKMRIDKEKKEFNEMIERGEEAVKLSSDLQRSFAQNGKLSENDVARLARVEKLAKKIRDELGGNDDDQLNSDKSDGIPSLPDAIDALKTTAQTLFDDLKKTTRFSISAAAIQSTNAVLKLAKILRFGH